MISEYTKRIDFTEDGDWIMARIIEVDTISEAREITKSLESEVTRSGCKRHYDIQWEGKGGKLIFTDKYVVDATEIAIESNNHYWATMRDMGNPDW